MSQSEKSIRRRRLRQAGVIGGVFLAHAGLFALFGVAGVPPITPDALPPIEVELFQFTPPPPPPPPDIEPSPEAGGGAPAAPSRVNRPPDPPRVQPELTAPPTPAPEPTLIIGASDKAGPTPGQGQGGEGAGTGTGRGEGDGPGSGAGAMILRGASNGEILAFVPEEARRRRQAGRSAVNCVIRSDTRLTDCRVVDEQPGGFGFGAAAIRIAEAHFRFRPPTTASGQAVDGYRVTVTVNFGRQGG